MLDRFGQIAPKVLLAVDGYHYTGKLFDRSDIVSRVAASLPSLTATVIVAVLCRRHAPREGVVNVAPGGVKMAGRSSSR